MVLINFLIAFLNEVAMNIELKSNVFHQKTNDNDARAIVMSLSDKDDDMILRFNGLPATAIEILSKNKQYDSEKLILDLNNRHPDVPQDKVKEFVEKFIADLSKLGYLANDN